jgi:hypothetical protein
MKIVLAKTVPESSLGWNTRKLTSKGGFLVPWWWVEAPGSDGLSTTFRAALCEHLLDDYVTPAEACRVYGIETA